MNRLIINLSFLSSQPTGLSVYASSLLPYLQSLNPTAISFHSIPNYHSYPIKTDLSPLRGTRGHLDRLIWTQFQLPRIYRELKSTLLFSPIPEAPIYSGCRYILTVHDFIPLRFPNFSSPLYQYFRWYLPQVLRQATHIICNSITTATEAHDRFAIPTAKITPIPLAYDADRFYPDEHDKIPDHPYFLYVGRHDPHKNVSRIVTAFAVSGIDSNYELWLAGASDGRYTPQLRAQVAELGLEKRVKFLDYLPVLELPQVIRQATALVFPSLWEGFGLPVLEAMACGTPVITSNISALTEVAGDAALLVDPYAVKEIAAAMSDLSTDHQLYQELRQAGLKRAHQFQWTKTARSTIEAISQFL